MRGVVVTGPRSLGVETIPDPTPGPGQLVLRVGACGICGSDLHAHQLGILPRGSVMGHEFAGEVMESGHGWKAGERACALPALSCGSCERCLSGLGVFCTHGMKSIGLGQAAGAYAEYVAVSDHHMVRLPADVDLRHGALGRAPRRRAACRERRRTARRRECPRGWCRTDRPRDLDLGAALRGAECRSCPRSRPVGAPWPRPRGLGRGRSCRRQLARRPPAAGPEWCRRRVRGGRPAGLRSPRPSNRSSSGAAWWWSACACSRTASCPLRAS